MVGVGVGARLEGRILRDDLAPSVGDAEHQAGVVADQGAVAFAGQRRQARTDAAAGVLPDPSEQAPERAGGPPLASQQPTMPTVNRNRVRQDRVLREHVQGESAAFSAFYAWNLERLAEAVEELGRGGREIRLLEEVLMLLDLDRRNRSRLYEQPEKRRRRLEKYLAAVSAGIGGRRVKVDCASLAADLRAKASALAARIREREWIALGPGEGFFNGYYDNRGRRVEGRCRGKILMMLPSQVFALMSGIATGEQVTAAARAVERHLRDARGGIRLNTDFGRCWEDIRLGRMSAFAYGEKENGAVFSHMAVMYACALYDRRRPRQGRRVWHAIYRLATDNRTARIFPGLPEYFNTAGRGMYCYLTGSASWMVFLLLTRVYGIRGRLGDLVINPQLMPEDYDASGRARVGCDFAGRRLEITFHNPERLAPERHRVAAVRVEGRELSGIPEPDGGIRIARRTIARLPAQRTNAVDVHLARI